jgi:hypothetical protein
MAAGTLTPAGIIAAVRRAGGNDALAVRARKAGDSYTVTMPASWTARYLYVHPESVDLGRAAERLSDALGMGVWVQEVRGARSADLGPLVKFDVSPAK